MFSAAIRWKICLTSFPLLRIVFLHGPFAATTKNDSVINQDAARARPYQTQDYSQAVQVLGANSEVVSRSL